MNSDGSKLFRMTRGDFILILTTSTISYQKGPSKTLTYYRFGKVRGASDGIVTTFFDHAGAVQNVPWRRVGSGRGRCWGIPADSVDAERFWRAIQERGDTPFETFEEAFAFAKQHKKGST